jgi:hypothetical protein
METGWRSTPLTFKKMLFKTKYFPGGVRFIHKIRIASWPEPTP